MNDRSWSCAEIATLIGVSARRRGLANAEAADPGNPPGREPVARPDAGKERRDGVPRHGSSR